MKCVGCKTSIPKESAFCPFCRSYQDTGAYIAHGKLSFTVYALVVVAAVGTIVACCKWLMPLTALAGTLVIVLCGFVAVFFLVVAFGSACVVYETRRQRSESLRADGEVETDDNDIRCPRCERWFSAHAEYCPKCCLDAAEIRSSRRYQRLTSRLRRWAFLIVACSAVAWYRTASLPSFWAYACATALMLVGTGLAIGSWTIRNATKMPQRKALEQAKEDDQNE